MTIVERKLSTVKNSSRPSRPGRTAMKLHPILISDHRLLDACTMPLALPRCPFGTSRVVAADQAGHWRVTKPDMTAVQR